MKNKYLSIIKNILLIALFLFILLFIYKYYLKYNSNQTFIVIRSNIIIMFILLGLYYIFNILDLASKKKTIIDKNKYNLINIIGLIPINLIFIRILFDKTIISNIKATPILDKAFLIGEGYSFIEYNSYVIIIILILLIAYRILNIKKNTK